MQFLLALLTDSLYWLIYLTDWFTLLTDSLLGPLVVGLKVVFIRVTTIQLYWLWECQTVVLFNGWFKGTIMLKIIFRIKRMRWIASYFSKTVNKLLLLWGPSYVSKQVPDDSALGMYSNVANWDGTFFLINVDNKMRNRLIPFYKICVLFMNIRGFNGKLFNCVLILYIVTTLSN